MFAAKRLVTHLFRCNINSHRPRLECHFSSSADSQSSPLASLIPIVVEQTVRIQFLEGMSLCEGERERGSDGGREEERGSDGGREEERGSDGGREEERGSDGGREEERGSDGGRERKRGREGESEGVMEGGSG